MENATKKCSKCGRELPLECFGKHKRMKDGLQPYCKECKKQYMKQYNKQYYADNADARKQYNKQWRAEHAEYFNQYYAEHKEDRLDYQKQYRAEHKEEIAEYFKQYKAEKYATLEGYARQIRYNNLQADRKYGRCGEDEDPLVPLEYYIWGIQQRDFYDGKQYHWSEMGFDRIDNSKPHTIDNIVPCSTKNNVRRQKMPFEEFCELMRKEKEEELELVL